MSRKPPVFPTVAQVQRILARKDLYRANAPKVIAAQENLPLGVVYRILRKRKPSGT